MIQIPGQAAAQLASAQLRAMFRSTYRNASPAAK